MRNGTPNDDAGRINKKVYFCIYRQISLYLKERPETGAVYANPENAHECHHRGYH